MNKFDNPINNNNFQLFLCKHPKLLTKKQQQKMVKIEIPINKSHDEKKIILIFLSLSLVLRIVDE